MIALSANAVVSNSPCTGSPIRVNVAVSADIAPAIQADARAFNHQDHKATGKCIVIGLTAGDSATQAGQIDGQVPLGKQKAAQAWIPDSSLWVDVARTYPAGAQTVQMTGISTAHSPLMLVTTPAVAAKTHIFDTPPGWNLLLPAAYGGPPATLGLGVELPDPTHTASGLNAIIEVNRLLGLGQTATTAFTSFVYSTASTENFDSATALAEFVGSTLSRPALTVASEQAVLAYDQANSRAPVVARYPTGTKKAFGSPVLDYPYVLTTSAGAPLAAATAFGKFLQTNYAQSAARYYGFRSANGLPDVMPAKAGLNSQTLQVATSASAGEAASSLQLWEKLGLGSRTLALIDVSAAMNTPDGIGNQTLEQGLTQTAARGLTLFPDSTQMGLWEIGNSKSTAQPYQALVPMGGLPDQFGLLTRRQQLERIIAGLHATNGTLALNNAILAAYKQQLHTYAPKYANYVVVLTSGIDNTRGDMSTAALLSQLHALSNPAKKVEIIFLVFGRPASFAGLQQIAAATGGAAYPISNPAEVGKIFVEAIARRVCSQGCAAP